MTREDVLSGERTAVWKKKNVGKLEEVNACT